MTEPNPYATPESDTTVTAARINFHDLDTKAVKKLRNNSHTIRTLGLLNLLGILIIAAVMVVKYFYQGDQTNIVDPILIVSIIVGLITIYAFWWRPAWGQAFGFISCALMLFGFPIGTIIGILGIIALAQSRALFGPERPLHRDLEKEWKYRKKNKIT